MGGVGTMTTMNDAEREAFEAKYSAARKLEFRGSVYLNRPGSELPRSVRDGINDAWVDFQAGAAWQRAQEGGCKPDAFQIARHSRRLVEQQRERIAALAASTGQEVA